MSHVLFLFSIINRNPNFRNWQGSKHLLSSNGQNGVAHGTLEPAAFKEEEFDVNQVQIIIINRSLINAMVKFNGLLRVHLNDGFLNDAHGQISAVL
jgi:hypothetical protein